MMCLGLSNAQRPAMGFEAAMRRMSLQSTGDIGAKS